MVKGKFELETGSGTDPAKVYGAVMVDNKGGTLDSKIWTDSELLYSSCAMDRVAEAARLSGGGTSLQLIGSRAWSEVPR